MFRWQRLGFLFLFCLLVSVSLVACGGPTTYSFIASDAQGIAFLSWTEQDGQLTGHYSYNGTGQNITGQVQDGRYTFRFVSATLVGTFHDQNLVMPMTWGDGSVGTQRWYPGTTQDYNQLYAAFVAYRKVAADVGNLMALQALPKLPNDSNPTYFQQAVLSAQKRVSDEKKGLLAIQKAGSATCAYIADFHLSFPAPYKDSVLQLPFSQALPFTNQAQTVQAVVNASGIAKSVDALQQDYQKASSLSLPKINGLPLSWQILPGQPLVNGQQQVAALQQEVTADAPQFTTLQGQAVAVQTQVGIVSQTAHC